MRSALENVQIDAMFVLRPMKQALSGKINCRVSQHLQLPRLLCGEAALCWRAAAGPGRS